MKIIYIETGPTEQTTGSSGAVLTKALYLIFLLECSLFTVFHTAQKIITSVTGFIVSRG